MFSIILGIIIIELIIKRGMEERLNENRLILKDKILLNKFHNTGIALSFLNKSVTFVKRATTVMIGGVFVVLCYLIHKKENRMFQIGLSMVLGGGISNLIDRYQYGYVVDYFSFQFGKKLKNIVFNIADLFIFLGSIVCLLSQILRKGK